ncbi:MAG: AAA family ATPase [Candidatus Colwellbacteria bacterium]|nr:AAA family ATPase [Candidatus Colwellbacteria bacterium]
MIIGLMGKMQAGKSTAATYLKEKHGFIVLSFGTVMKEMLIKAKMATRESLYENKTDESRLLMQQFATDLVRDQIDQDFWVKKLVNQVREIISESDGPVNFIIDDVRFQNEAQMIQLAHGGYIVQINRYNHAPSMNGVGSDHRSEKEQDEIISDYVIMNNGTIQALYKQIDDMVNFALRK